MAAAAFLAKISPKRDFNGNHAYFFYFVTWYSLIFLMVSVVFTDIFRTIKLKTLVVFMKPNKKKIETSEAPRWARGPPLRPPLRASRSGLRYGPRAQRGASEVSIYFFVKFHETNQGFDFSCQKYPGNH